MNTNLNVFQITVSVTVKIVFIDV